MKTFLIALLLVLASPLSARTLMIGPGEEFATLQQAAAQAQPGDTLRFATGVHAGAGHIIDLQGTEADPIVIRGDNSMTAIIRGGSNGFQLTDARHVRIERLVFEEQTGNGLNIDDGGTPETPSNNIVIENCEWRSMNASGNNDELKMSGIEDFVVRNCKFMNGSEGGSMIDMVGCHRGLFYRNHFDNAGSNCIQAKGATSDIVIEANWFKNGGQRAINIGGSTGLEFFRPLGAKYEAKNIAVYSNIFEGGVAAVAYVGAIDSRVVNNTIVRPERWAIRILQENITEGMLPSGNNSFINNIVVFASAQPAINIGPNTAPETFTFSHNLWYNPDNWNWSGPNIPVNEPGRILQQDPYYTGDFSLMPGSPAIHAGLDVEEPAYDMWRKPFASPRSIGAVEVSTADVVEGANEASHQVYPNPATNYITITGTGDARIVDLLGLEYWSGSITGSQQIEISSLPPGAYVLINGSVRERFIKR